MPRGTRVRSTVVAATRSYPAVVVAALVVGLLLSPVVWSATAPAHGAEAVAVIPLAGFIDGPNAADVGERLREARTDPDVRAVVLVVDSAGGQASASEELHFQVERTASVMPVIAVVDSAATSGAYMAILPADAIYVKPSSTVGSVGTTVARPPSIGPLDSQITSGPDKLTGTSPRQFEYYVEMVTESFLTMVEENRGEDLALSREELARASIYLGVQAVEVGLVDEVGDVQTGVQRAADEASLERYRVRTLQYDTPVQFLSPSARASATVPEKTLMTRTDVATLREDPVLPSVLLVPPTAGTPSNTTDAGPSPSGEEANATGG